MKRLLLLATLFSFQAFAGRQAPANDLLVKFKEGTPRAAMSSHFNALVLNGAKVEKFQFGNWAHVVASETASNQAALQALSNDPNVEYVQPNYRLHLLNDYKMSASDPRLSKLKKLIAKMRKEGKLKFDLKDNPEVPAVPTQRTGADPEFKNQWGMIDIGVENAWKRTRGSDDMVVAVIDTGVDYTHEDLLPNIWRNAGEMGKDANGKDKSNNGVDDDKNGYIDDVIGWDFASNDNKPYDMTVPWWQMLMGGGNPGHGTHCAGNVGARGGNGIGISGVIPNVKIMALRFLTEKGEGTTAGAIKAIEYAVKNGAKVLSNSWGSEGEDPQDGDNKALREMIQFAQSQGTLFVAAAGNGHQGVGYDNDTDSKPGYPASYSYETIVSVAAVDKNDKLGSFSNWGAKTVHIGAPGVAVFSTMVDNKYSDTVLKMDQLGLDVKWDGTSMATPHVAGAAALYWSLHPTATFGDVKRALLNSAKPIGALSGKSVSGGKLNVEALINY